MTKKRRDRDSCDDHMRKGTRRRGYWRALEDWRSTATKQASVSDRALEHDHHRNDSSNLTGSAAVSHLRAAREEKELDTALLCSCRSEYLRTDLQENDLPQNEQQRPEAGPVIEPLFEVGMVRLTFFFRPL